MLVLSMISLGSTSVYPMEYYNSEQCDQLCKIMIASAAVVGTAITGYAVKKTNQFLRNKDYYGTGRYFGGSMSSISMEELRNVMPRDIYSDSDSYHLPDWMIASSLRKLDTLPLLKGIVNYLVYHHDSDYIADANNSFSRALQGLVKLL